jgi:hypothetical protein
LRRITLHGHVREMKNWKEMIGQRAATGLRDASGFESTLTRDERTNCPPITSQRRAKERPDRSEGEPTPSFPVIGSLRQRIEKAANIRSVTTVLGLVTGRRYGRRCPDGSPAPPGTENALFRARHDNVTSL